MKLKFLLSCLALGVGVVSVLVGSGFSAFAFGGVDKVDGKVSTITKTDVEYPTYTISRAYSINDSIFTDNNNLYAGSGSALAYGNGIGRTGNASGIGRWNAYQEYLPSAMVTGTSKYFRIKVADDKGNALSTDALKAMNLEMVTKSNGLTLVQPNKDDPTLFKLTIGNDAPTNQVISFSFKDKKLPDENTKSDTFSFTLYDNQEQLLLNVPNFRPLGSQGDQGAHRSVARKFWGITTGHKDYYFFGEAFSYVWHGNNVDAQNKDTNGRNFAMSTRVDINWGSTFDVDGKYYLNGTGKEVNMSNSEVMAGNWNSQFMGGGSVNDNKGGDWSTNINGGDVFYVNSEWKDNQTDNPFMMTTLFGVF